MGSGKAGSPPGSKRGINWATTGLFTIYLAAVFWILLFKMGIEFAYMDERLVNWVPFHYAGITSTLNLLNIAVFVPLGIYAEVLAGNWGFGKKVLFLFSVSLVIEGLQYLLAVGAFDTTDLITNTSGGIMGLLVWKGVKKAFNDRVQAQRWVNIIGGAATVLLCLFLLLLRLNLLPVRYR